jgi:threonine dehydratase
MIPSPYLAARFGAEFYLKLENMQPIGAFKLRGAYNAVASLPHDVTGVTCCSTGNHGRGVAYAAAQRGIRAVICMSNLVPQAKIDGIRALGAEVRICGTSQDDALRASQELARDQGFVEISPFDDPNVIAGQGTIGLEMVERVPNLATILVPLSGGGLAAGVALAAKSINPNIRVIGISMDRGAAMHASIQAGHPVEVEEVASLADSLGGGIGLDNVLSYPMCRDLLDDIVLVSEEEIRDALQVLYFEDRIIAEGACVVGIAALLAGKVVPQLGPVATIITGRNLDMDLFSKVIMGHDVTLGTKILKGKPYGQ